MGLKDFQSRHCHFMLHSTATLCFKAQGSQAASVGPRSVNQSHAISTETIKWPQVSILNHNVAGSIETGAAPNIWSRHKVFVICLQPACTCDPIHLYYRLFHVIAQRFADYQRVRAVARRDRARVEVR